MMFSSLKGQGSLILSLFLMILQKEEFFKIPCKVILIMSLKTLIMKPFTARTLLTR